MPSYMIEMTKDFALLGLTVLIWGLTVMMLVLILNFIRDLFR